MQDINQEILDMTDTNNELVAEYKVMRADVDKFSDEFGKITSIPAIIGPDKQEFAYQSLT